MSYCHTVAQKYASDGIYHCIRIVHFFISRGYGIRLFSTLLCFACFIHELVCVAHIKFTDGPLAFSQIAHHFYFFNCIAVGRAKFFVPDDGGRRRHSRKLFKRQCRLDVKKIAFSNRIFDNWNSLSENCVSCTMLNNFKSNIRLHWDWKLDSIV